MARSQTVMYEEFWSTVSNHYSSIRPLMSGTPKSEWGNIILGRQWSRWLVVYLNSARRRSRITPPENRSSRSWRTQVSLDTRYARESSLDDYDDITEIEYVAPKSTSTSTFVQSTAKNTAAGAAAFMKENIPSNSLVNLSQVSSSGSVESRAFLRAYRIFFQRRNIYSSRHFNCSTIVLSTQRMCRFVWVQDKRWRRGTW